MATIVSLLRFPRLVLNNTAEQVAKNFHCASVVCSDQDSEQRMTLREIERDKRQKRSEFITECTITI